MPWSLSGRFLLGSCKNCRAEAGGQWAMGWSIVRQRLIAAMSSQSRPNALLLVWLRPRCSGRFVRLRGLPAEPFRIVYLLADSFEDRPVIIDMRYSDNIWLLLKKNPDLLRALQLKDRPGMNKLSPGDEKMGRELARGSVFCSCSLVQSGTWLCQVGKAQEQSLAQSI
jgi:hypothetical protein